MNSGGQKQLEVTRQTIRRFAIWHFARWFFVPIFVLSTIVVSSWYFTGEFPFVASDSADSLSYLGSSIGALVAGAIIVRIINSCSADQVVSIDAALLALTILAWSIVIPGESRDALGISCFVILLVAAIVSVIGYGLRVNASNLLAKLSDEERDAIDESARHF